MTSMCTGTYIDQKEEDSKLYASVAGVVERINKLVCVRALKTRYSGEVGDVVVGRIKEVQQKRWKASDCCSLARITNSQRSWHYIRFCEQRRCVETTKYLAVPNAPSNTVAQSNYECTPNRLLVIIFFVL